MYAEKVFQLMEQYLYCPDCGNQFVGNGTGSINITEDQFTRTCECGFQKTIKIPE
ncbi:DUF3797 domain-containing protein [Gracilibacillus sp. YIM 98692]|uniref:DUF3797 domain-containing protein n=1 Tax=Gracilibacillus sp. YIM 98692 TaxID=2663532 RepID=UPI0013D798BD|nr:DUF3797 domain-containing protein [Gracilibacillus sp. YIM 98692]